MKSHRNKRIITVSFCLSAIILAGCSNSNNSDKSPEGLDRLTWISPRGSLDVMDDYFLWVGSEMGYFEELDIELSLEPGPEDAAAATKFVAEGQADIGAPDPAILASSVQQEVPVTSIFNVQPTQIFDFAIPKDSEVETVQDLAGKSIAVEIPGWQEIIDPMLVEAGVDPDSVEIVEAGSQYGQAVADSKVDAALGWEGMRAQWEGQGIEVDWLLGTDFSDQPANVLVVRDQDLDDSEARDAIVRFLRGLIMGQEFADANPAAAAQITYEQLPDLAETLEPDMAFESMVEIQKAYSASHDSGELWGHHDEDSWDLYLDIASELGQVDEDLDPEELYTNDLIEEANDIDLEKVRKDAEEFELDDVFSDFS